MNGKVVFANNECYDVALTVADDVLKLSAALHPTLVDVAPPRPPERFGDDPRDGDQVIQQVHSGSRRRVAAPRPKEQ